MRFYRVSDQPNRLSLNYRNPPRSSPTIAIRTKLIPMNPRRRIVIDTFRTSRSLSIAESCAALLSNYPELWQAATQHPCLEQCADGNFRFSEYVLLLVGQADWALREADAATHVAAAEAAFVRVAGLEQNFLQMA
jgi:hypothetical protein